MKLFFTFVAFALASIASAAPAERRQQQTSFLICKEKNCTGDGSQQITIDLTYRVCKNFPAGWNNTARAASANGDDYCFLHDGDCGDQQGAGILVRGRENDLEARNFDRIASSVTCYPASDFPPTEKQKSKRQAADTNILLCTQKTCTGFPGTDQFPVGLIFGQCYDFPATYDNKVLAARANGNAACFIYEGHCNDQDRGNYIRFVVQVDDLTAPEYAAVGSRGSSITCYPRSVVTPPQ